MTQTSGVPQFVTDGPIVVYEFTYRVYERAAQAMRDGGLGDYKVEKHVDQLDAINGHPLEGAVRVNISGPNRYFGAFYDVAQPAVVESMGSGMSGASDEVRLANADRIISEEITVFRTGIERR